MIGGQRAYTDGVDVLFQGLGDDVFDRLPRRRIDHFHAGVAQKPGDQPRAAIMAVEANLGDHHLGPPPETLNQVHDPGIGRRLRHV